MSTTPPAASAKPSSVTLLNTGTRRVIIGAPAKSKGGGSIVMLGAQADQKVPAGKRLADTKVVEGAMAERIRSSKVIEGVGAKLGLKVG